jgi:hypothetical protein
MRLAEVVFVPTAKQVLLALTGVPFVGILLVIDTVIDYGIDYSM